MALSGRAWKRYLRVMGLLGEKNAGLMVVVMLLLLLLAFCEIRADGCGGFEICARLRRMKLGLYRTVLCRTVLSIRASNEGPSFYVGIDVESNN